MRSPACNTQGSGNPAQLAWKFLLVYVQADSHDHKLYLRGLGVHLRQYAADFFAFDQQIVGPLQIDRRSRLRLNGGVRRQPRHHGEQGSLHRRKLRPQ